MVPILPQFLPRYTLDTPTVDTRRIRPESLRFTPYVFRMCLVEQARLSTDHLGKINHANKLYHKRINLALSLAVGLLTTNPA